MRVGMWLIGARGSVAVTSMVGSLAIRHRLAGTTGLVTELRELRSPLLPELGDLFVGGHDISSVSLVKKAQDLVAMGVIPGAVAEAVAAELGAIEPDIRPLPAGANQADVAYRMVADLAAFRDRHWLDRVVVVNVSSTEPPQSFEGSLCELRTAMARSPVLSCSSLYAYAAMTAGCAYVDFTPSIGARLPALHELSLEAGVPYAGNDGKTGETLVKSVLAPMFAMRNLSVRSWSGVNLLGGGDGATLAEPGPYASKAASKQRVLRETLGYQPAGQTRIEYVPELGDQKTAWDMITFNGFLGTGMRLDFTWHGCDSALAAPLVLDLVRLVAAAHAQEISGPLPQLAFFFKDPVGEVPHGLAAQWQVLCDWVAGWPDAA